MIVKCNDIKKFEKLNAWFDVPIDKLELEVLDESIPKNWVENKYKRFFELRNDKYDFSIPIKTYIGPPEFIEDNDFLFDIYDNPSKANEFLIKFIEKHKEI